MNIIDPHLHLFNLDQGKYEWLQPGAEPNWLDKEKIFRNYSENDLKLPENLELSGFIHIEAGFDNEQPWCELQWLEQHCSLPFRSIAFADMTSERFPEQLQELLGYQSLAGIRYILGENAAELLSDSIFQKNLALLEESNLIFEAQFPFDQCETVQLFIEVLTQRPKLKVVLNHVGLPSALSQKWMDAVTALAHLPECYVKCSGWEMQKRDWTVDSVKPYIGFVIRQFGLTRVMLASNFPVSELGCSYSDLWQRYFTEMKFKEVEKELLLHDTAQQVYGLQD
ncbi:MAG: amidohydrolase family protein [Neptuniibacter sp.]